jgi:hypothetical protein
VCQYLDKLVYKDRVVKEIIYKDSYKDFDDLINNTNQQLIKNNNNKIKNLEMLSSYNIDNVETTTILKIKKQKKHYQYINNDKDKKYFTQKGYPVNKSFNCRLTIGNKRQQNKRKRHKHPSFKLYQLSVLKSIK